ncbi:MAG: hypothetical protein E7584_04365 [Ruminococcaceae bacterium]|nr:hypothetical protein [Oscillospiraceae bacterium]
MANTKTLYKANGSEVTFVDTSKEVKKAIEKLSKEALGASAKVIRKKLRGDLPVYTKRFKNHIASWKFIDRQTGQPTLHIGFYSWQRVKKKGKLPSHASPWWIEFGTNPHIIRPKNAKIMWYKDSFGTLVQHPGQSARHLLRNTIQNNIGEIRAAQEEYLDKINQVLDAADIEIPETADEEND